MVTAAMGAEVVPTGSRRRRRGLLLSIACFVCLQETCQAVRIGVLLKSSHRDAWREYESAMSNFNTSQNARRLGIEFDTHRATVDDDLFTVTHELCRQLSAGVTTVLLPTTGFSEQAVHSLFASTNVPRITTTVPASCAGDRIGSLVAASIGNDTSTNGTTTSTTADEEQEEAAMSPPLLGVSMMPDLSPAVLDLAQIWQFRSVVFFYDSDHALVTLERLLQPPAAGGRRLAVSRARRVSRSSEAHAVLSSLERADPHGRKLVVLDCEYRLAKDIVIRHVRDVYMGRRNYHYVLARPVVSHRYLEGVSEFAAINITAFRFQNTEELTRTYNYETTAEEAAIVDAGQLVISAYRTLREEPPVRNGDLFEHRVRNTGVPSSCGRIAYLTEEQGRVVDAYLKGVVFDGKTGRVEFDERGCRVNFTVDVIQVNGKNQWLKTGTWSSSSGFLRAGREGEEVSKDHKDYVYNVTTTPVAPLMMLRKGREISSRMDVENYEGFSKDLMEAISRISGIKYAMHFAKDGYYETQAYEPWKGMIGELVRGEADVAVGDLTTGSKYSNDVDFTLPVLTAGLAAITKKVSLKGVASQTFAMPFDWYLWLGLVTSLGAVIVFLISFGVVSVKTAHCCYKPPEKDPENANKIVMNYVQPNVPCADFKARSIAGRILSSFWWIFVVLVFSTYTTELSSYLKPRYERDSWEDLDSTSLKHMWVPTPATRSYFSKSKDETTQKIYSRMLHLGGREVESLQEGIELVRKSATGNVVVFSDALPAEYLCAKLACSTRVIRAQHTTRHVALAVQKGAQLRETLNKAIATLSETGELEEIKRRWWSTRCDTPPKDEPIQLKLFLPVIVCLGLIAIEGTGVGLGELLVRGCNKLCIWARLRSKRSTEEPDPPVKTIA